MDTPEWRIEKGLTDYAAALSTMERHVEAIRHDNARERIWLVEHPPVYTAGTSADASDLLDPARFPVVQVGRGGRHTYHGPGQRVGYLMLDLDKRGRDLRCFVDAVESWLIDALDLLGVQAFQAPGRVGVWTMTPQGEAKIAAIGVRVRRWVSYHGFALNVAPDLDHFGGIIPCGLPDYPVTSLEQLQRPHQLSDADDALYQSWPRFLARLPVR